MSILKPTFALLAGSLLALGSVASAQDAPPPVDVDDPATPSQPEEREPLPEPQGPRTDEPTATEPPETIPEDTTREDTDVPPPPEPPQPPEPAAPPPEPPAPPPVEEPSQVEPQEPGQTQSQIPSEVTNPKLDTAEVMQTTQTALTHISAAETALQDNKIKAAKSALAKSEKALEKLYNAPALAPVVNEIDQAIESVDREEQDLETLDLAPLGATVRSYKAYVDPAVIAGVEQARQSAQQGDKKATREALELARSKVAVDVAMLPVEDAYVRVLAAQHALDAGDRDTAKRLLRNVPIVVAEVQMSRPLVPIRFKLNAAAEAAEAQNFKRAETLLREVNQDMQRLETASKGTDLAPELEPIANEIEQISKQARSGEELQPQEIREIAQRTRSIGADEEQPQPGQPQQEQPMQQEDRG